MDVVSHTLCAHYRIILTMCHLLNHHFSNQIVYITVSGIWRHSHVLSIFRQIIFRWFYFWKLYSFGWMPNSLRINTIFWLWKCIPSRNIQIINLSEWCRNFNTFVCKWVLIIVKWCSNIFLFLNKLLLLFFKLLIFLLIKMLKRR